MLGSPKVAFTHPGARLLALSAVMLYTELTLIRWLGSNILYLSYFSNFVLLASFLGIGLGFLANTRSPAILSWVPVGLALLVGGVLSFQVSVDRGSQPDLILVGSTVSGVPAWIVLPVVFAAVAVIMAMIARAVRTAFADFKPIDAYRLDIAGSLVGIALFAIFSFLDTPPLVWFGVVLIPIAVLQRRHLKAVTVVAGIAMLVMLGKETFTAGNSWSPYYKLNVYSTTDNGHTYDEVSANGVPFQAIYPVSEIKKYGPTAYFAAFNHMHQTPANVLIIGAGTGKDVAVALSEGVRHIDAVEIDPQIVALGQQRNTDQPFADPRVTTYINDGRAFLEGTTTHYDMIEFAVTDSLTVVSGQASLRLESYLFTQESLQTVARHLNPGGVFAAYNFYWQPWYVDRLAATMVSAFGHAPCVDVVSVPGSLESLSVSANAADLSCPGALWQGPSDGAVAPVSDDYPFAYLRTPSIPPIYLLTLLGIVLVAGVGVKVSGASVRRMRPYMDLFFMGAGFLLLETKGVVQFALLFGTTWFVNALVFGGVLVSVLIAVAVTRRFPPKDAHFPVWFGLLAVSLVAAWFIPVDSLLGLPWLLRLGAAALVGFVPILFANIIFARRFRAVAASTDAFATNLLGAMVGGVTEYLSLLFGYRTLLIAVAAMYVIACVLLLRVGRTAAA